MTTARATDVFTPTMLDLLARRQLTEHIRTTSQALTALALLTAAIWALL